MRAARLITRPQPVVTRVFFIGGSLRERSHLKCNRRSRTEDRLPRQVGASAASRGHGRHGRWRRSDNRIRYDGRRLVRRTFSRLLGRLQSGLGDGRWARRRSGGRASRRLHARHGACLCARRRTIVAGESRIEGDRDDERNRVGRLGARAREQAARQRLSAGPGKGKLANHVTRAPGGEYGLHRKRTVVIDKLNARRTGRDARHEIASRRAVRTGAYFQVRRSHRRLGRGSADRNRTVKALGFTQHIIYSLYPVIPTTPHLNAQMGPPFTDACNNSPVDCHLVDLEPLFKGQHFGSDNTHPDATGAVNIGDAWWNRRMKVTECGQLDIAASVALAKGKGTCSDNPLSTRSEKEPLDWDRGPRRNRDARATARAMKFFCRVAMNRLGAPASELAFGEKCTARSVQSTMASAWRFACA